MPPRILRALWTGFIAAMALFTLHAQETVIVVDVPVIGTGGYDIYGEYFPNNGSLNETPFAGRSTVSDGRAPRRSFVAFHVPNFPGTVTNAVLVFWSYDFGSDGQNETLRIRDVTTPVDVLRQGGFGLTDVYADLADGTFICDVTLPRSYAESPMSQSLSPAFFPIISAARGSDIAIGGELISLNTNANLPSYFSEYIGLAPGSISLRLFVSVPSAPQVYVQPSVTVLASNMAAASVEASGANPLQYRWFVDGALVSDADAPHVGLGTFGADSFHSVFVIISNSFGAVTSAVTQFTYPVASVQMPFTNALARMGDTVGFIPFVIFNTNSAGGYQWNKEGVALPGRTALSLILSNLSLDDSGNYTLIVSNAAGAATSAVVRLDVIEVPPVFWFHPVSKNVAYGDTLEIHAAPEGSVPMGMQWFHDGTPVPGVPNSPRNYYKYPANFSDGGDYWMVATNSAGITTSRVAHINVVLDPPVFTRQPPSTNVYAGHSFWLFTDTLGRPSPQYQWYQNDLPLQNQTSSALYFFRIHPSQAGSYYCIASNASGVVTSQVATISVMAIPPLLGELTNATAGVGKPFSWYVNLSNPPADIRLQFHGTNLPGYSHTAFFSTIRFSFPIAQTNQSGPYRVIASNEFGMSTSRVATLTVSPLAPMFTSPPFIPDVLEGATAVFWSTAGAAPPPDYYLLREGEFRQFSSNGQFRLPWITLADAGDYFVVASNFVGMTTSQVARLTVLRAGPLDRWTKRSPLPQGSDLHSIVWAQNKFAAVGENGALITSHDGTNWNVRSQNTPEDFTAIAFGNDRFVAVGDRGTALISTNGEKWNSVLVRSNTELRAITFGNGVFLAVGEGNPPPGFSSTNGMDWSAVTLPSCCGALRFDTAAFGAGRFVVADNATNAYSSTDLLSWTRVPDFVPQPSRGVYLNDGFVILGDNGVMAASADGLGWIPVLNAVTTRDLHGLAHDGHRYVAVGARGEIITAVGLESAWTSVSSVTADRLEDVTFGNNLFVAIGERGTILTSNDGFAWANQLRGNGNDLDGLAVGGGLAVAVGKNGTILTSPDGRDWIKRAIPTNSAESDWHGVAYGDGKFVAVGEGTNILVSANGIDWTAHTYVASRYDLKNLVWGGGQWVAVGAHGVILTSDDALTWTQQTSGTNSDLNDISYGEGVYITVGDHLPDPNGTILFSGDGVTWTNRSIANGKNLRGITYQNGVFVIAGNDDQIWFGNSQILYWQIAHNGAVDGNNLRSTTWSSNLWVTVGNNGRILSSTNGQYWFFISGWRPRVSPTVENLHAVRYLAGAFIAVGNQGAILQSGPLQPRLSAGIVGTNLQLSFSSPYEGVFRLQESSDFTWHDKVNITNVTGVVEKSLPLDASGKFFRVIAPE